MPERQVESGTENVASPRLRYEVDVFDASGAFCDDNVLSPTPTSFLGSGCDRRNASVTGI